MSKTVFTYLNKKAELFQIIIKRDFNIISQNFDLRKESGKLNFSL